MKGENESKCILKACCSQVYELGCELFDDPTFFWMDVKKTEVVGETESSSCSSSLLPVAGEARQTLMMSDRTLTLDSLQGGVLKWSLTPYFSISDLCIIYAFVSAIYQQFYTSQPHSTVHLP